MRGDIEMTQSATLSWEFASSSVPTSDESTAATMFCHGTLEIKASKPKAPNVQTPHSQDELYFVASGGGVFFHDGQRSSFDAGDVLFVAAGTEHHFEDVSADLQVWVIFYGPPGGEAGHPEVVRGGSRQGAKRRAISRGRE